MLIIKDKRYEGELWKIVFLIGCLLICFGSANASYCYQESANTTNKTGKDGSCGLDYNGTYAYTGTCWAGYTCNHYWGGGESMKASWLTTVPVNTTYVKPLNSIDGSLWQIEDFAKYNLSIVSDCWNYNSTHLILQGKSTSTSTSMGWLYADWYCWHGSWHQLAAHSASGNLTMVIREEAMYWNIDQAANWSSPTVNNTQLNLATLFSINWTDDVNLSGYIFSTNNSTAWVNDSFVSISGTSNVSQIIKTPTSIGNYYWIVYANDSKNQWNVTDAQSLSVVETTHPQYSSNSSNKTNPMVGETVLLSLAWTDNYNLSSYVFSTNSSGTWVNDTSKVCYQESTN